MRTTPWYKITDEEICQHIREGRTAKEIAEIANMHPLTIRNRIKALEQSGEMLKKIAKGAEEESFIEFDDGSRINRLDTIVHIGTKKRYRVAHIYGEVIVLKQTISEAYLRNHTLKPVMISREILYKEYEKKDYGEVTCYIDESLIQKSDSKLAEKEKRTDKDMWAYKNQFEGTQNRRFR